MHVLFQCELCDIWRYFHSVDERVTWSKQSPYCALYLVNNTLRSNGISSSIVSYVKSDYCAVVLECKFDKQSRGIGYWKFNNALLKDGSFTEMIHLLLDDIDSTYSSILDAQLLWDFCKRLAPTRRFFLALGLCLAFSKISCVDLRQAQQRNELSHLAFFVAFFVAICLSVRHISIKNFLR